jgi:hypothetical protein
MGYLSAQAMAEATDLRTALGWHLSANHYPPVPATMIDPCIAAIEAGDAEEWDQMIPLPEGVLWRDHDHAPAWALIEGFHLDAFLTLDAWGED